MIALVMIIWFLAYTPELRHNFEFRSAGFMGLLLVTTGGLAFVVILQYSIESIKQDTDQ
jgi:hypothetical protein